MKLTGFGTRAAAGQQYAIVVGLIAVIAILAITSAGQSMGLLLGSVSNTIGNVENVTAGQSAPPPVTGCAAARASCAAHYAAGCTSDGTYQVTGLGTVTCNMSLQGGGWTRCFNVTNTSGIDLPHTNANWFDTCVDYSNASWATGNKVMVKLNDSGGTTVYSASGTRNGAWTYDQLTSTQAVGSQHLVGAGHDRYITLDNGHVLSISGRNASNTGCGGSYGNGYGISIRSTAANTYYTSQRIIVNTTNHVTSNVGGIRSFSGWSSSHEISYSTTDFSTCTSTPSALNYSFEFFVK